MEQQLRAFLQGLFNLSNDEYRDTLCVEDIANWDSLKHMELVTGLESQFGITLDMMEIVHMRSIGAIVSTLQNKGIAVGK